MEAELFGDALGTHNGLVVHAARADDAGEQGAALVVAECGGLDRVLPLLARDEGPASGATRARASDLYFRAVEPDVDAFGICVGEQVVQGADAQTGAVGDGEAPRGEQGSDLADRGGDGGAVHPVQLGQGGVWQPEPQVDQGGREPVGEHQARLASGTLGPLAGAAPHHVQGRRAGRRPGWGEFFEQRPKYARETPDRAGWVQDVRAQVSFTTHLTRTALPLARPARPTRIRPRRSRKFISRGACCSLHRDTLMHHTRRRDGCPPRQHARIER